MRIRSKKGYALPMVLIFAVILLITTTVLYSAIYFLLRETKVKRVEHIKGYYYCMAGLRFAGILLRRPTEAPLNFDDNENDGDTRTLNVITDSDPKCVYFRRDLGLDGSYHSLIIKIRESGESGSSPGPYVPEDKYGVSATYTY